MTATSDDKRDGGTCPELFGGEPNPNYERIANIAIEVHTAAPTTMSSVAGNGGRFRDTATRHPRCFLVRREGFFKKFYCDAPQA